MLGHKARPPRVGENRTVSTNNIQVATRPLALRGYSAFVLLALIISGCGKKADRDASRLRQHVSTYCFLLASELDRAAQKYRQIAPQFEEMSVEQRRRAELVLRMDSIGTTEDVRTERLRDLHTRLTFCLNARKFDDKRRDEIYIRTTHLKERLGPNLHGVLPAHEDAIKMLDELAAAAREVDALPLTD